MYTQSDVLERRFWIVFESPTIREIGSTLLLRSRFRSGPCEVIELCIAVEGTSGSPRQEIHNEPMNTRSRARVLALQNRCAIVLLALAMLSAAPVRAQQQAAAGGVPHGALYLVGTRHLARLDLGSNAMKVWPLLSLAGFHNSPDCSGRHVPTSCDWNASEARLDLINRRLYFVAPRTPPGDESETDEKVERVGRLHSVWAIDLDGMKLVKRIDLQAPNVSHTIILTPDGKQLLMS